MHPSPLRTEQLETPSEFVLLAYGAFQEPKGIHGMLCRTASAVHSTA